MRSLTVELTKRLNAFANPRLDVVLCHFSVLVRQEFLRVRQIPRIGRGFCADVSELKIHLR
jgi:hypothetical protein